MIGRWVIMRWSPPLPLPHAIRRVQKEQLRHPLFRQSSSSSADPDTSAPSIIASTIPRASSSSHPPTWRTTTARTNRRRPFTNGDGCSALPPLERNSPTDVIIRRDVDHDDTGRRTANSNATTTARRNSNSERVDRYSATTNNNNKDHRRHPQCYSMRLINENAARRTTDLFLHACSYNNDDDDDDDTINSSSNIGRSGRTRRRRAIWKDATNSFHSAELALEFWAHRCTTTTTTTTTTNSNNGGGNKANNSSSSTLEADAETALRLFVALHDFHFSSYSNNNNNDNNDNNSTNVSSSSSSTLVLTNGMYSHVIDALAKSPNLDHIVMADVLLRQFILLYINRVDRRKGATAAAAAAAAAGVNLDDASSQQDRLPSEVRPIPSLECPNGLRWNDKDRHHYPNMIRITGVMRGYARSLRPIDAERLLNLMISLSTSSLAPSPPPPPPSSSSSSFSSMFRPNDVSYATVIDAYSRIHDGPNAERVLEMMKYRNDDNKVVVVDEDDNTRRINHANIVAYNATISAWARSARKRTSPTLGDVVSSSSSSRLHNAPSSTEISSSRLAAESAERLLREMWTEHEHCRSSSSVIMTNSSNNNRRRRSNTLLPDVITYSTVISAYAACLDQPFGVTAARKLLTEMEDLVARELDDDEVSHGGDGGGGGGRHPHGFQPNTLTYNALLQAYANAGDATSAEGLLESMISLHSSSLDNDGGGGVFRHVRPTTRTFNVVLNALAKGDGGDGGVRASKILNRLVELGADKDGPRPDVITYNTVLSAWSRSASVCPTSVSSFGEEGDEKPERIVGELAAFEALTLLDEIEERYLHSFKRNQNRSSHVIKPDLISYNTTIAAFANAAQHNNDGVTMAQKAEEILSRIINLGIEPDAYSYNGVILAWARSSGGLAAAEHAESILRSMKAPTIVSWSTVMTAYAHADGAHRAEALLREMEEIAIPSTELYNNVLHSWVMSSHDYASRNAELLLGRMEEASSQSPKPDIISYQMVLNALEHSKDHDKAARAELVLDRLLALVFQQSCFKHDDVQNAFNSVLTACAYTPADAAEHHRKNAARILVQTLSDMNQFPWPDIDGGVCIKSGPNQETYAHFVQGCIHLYGPMSDVRDELLYAAFYECCQKGLLNRVIWDKFCGAIGPKAAQKLIAEISLRGKTELGYDELPEEWRRNCPIRR